jgi:hypothetical protein
MFQNLVQQGTGQVTWSASIEPTLLIQPQSYAATRHAKSLDHTRPWIFSSSRFSVFWTQSLDACVIQELIQRNF